MRSGSTGTRVVAPLNWYPLSASLGDAPTQQLQGCPGILLHDTAFRGGDAQAVIDAVRAMEPEAIARALSGPILSPPKEKEDEEWAAEEENGVSLSQVAQARSQQDSSSQGSKSSG